MRAGKLSILFVTAVALLTASPVLGQDKPSGRDTQAAKDEVGSYLDIQAMIDQATNNVSRRYNLNPKQHEYTQQMMNEGVNQFLQEHQDELFPIIRDVLRARMAGGNASTEQLKRIAKSAQPIIDAAREEILEYNRRWGEMLSEEQKQLHEWDLREMEGQFDSIRNNFRRMESGSYVENPWIPTKKPDTPPPPLPTKPPVYKTRPPKLEPVVTKDPDGAFERYVQKFITDYELDKAQSESARSIGREYKGFAEGYRKAHQADYESARKEAEAARKAGDLDKVRAAEAKEEQLNARIRSWLEEMKGRLMSIPRQAQRDAFAAKQGQGGKTDSSAKPAKADEKKPKTEAAPAKPKAKPAKKPKAKPAAKPKDKPKS